MQIKEIKQDGLSHEMEITVTSKDIDERIDARIKEAGKTMSLPGFRAGKVPMKILKQKYGRAVMGEVLEQAVNETSMKALKDKNLEPAMQPKIEVKEFDEGKDLVYSMNVEVLPTFDVMDFKGLKLEKLVATPDDKAVDDALERIAQSNSSTKKIEGNRGAKNGDTLIMDFDGRTADDDVHHDGMKSEGHRLELGSGMFIPGFEDQLIGAKAGTDVEVKVSFPENYGAKELAGRDAIFDVKVHEIHEKADAEINDDLAKNLGLDDLSALKDAVKEQLGKELEQNSRLELKKKLLDVLDEGHSFEIPPTMLSVEHDNILQQIDLEKQRNPEADQAELSDEEKAEFKDIAARRVRLGLLLARIGKDANIQIADMDLQKAVISEAQKYPGQEKEVFDYYSKNQQALESLRAPLFEDKAVDYIFELATITEKDVSAEDLMSALDGDDEADEKPKAKKKPAAKKAAASGNKKPAAKKKAPAKKAASKKKAS